MSKVTITERGWAGHFCAASHCLFRRNTLINNGKRGIVVSTVGNLHYPPDMEMGGGPQEIGIERYYETMAFEAAMQDGYMDADVTHQLDFPHNWAICAKSAADLGADVDKQANDMHERVVAHFVEQLGAHHE